MSEITLDEYLQEKTKTKSVFSLAELKRTFPKDKKTIDKYSFLGIIERASFENLDSYKALYYPQK